MVDPSALRRLTALVDPRSLSPAQCLLRNLRFDFGKIQVEMERLANRTAPERGKCQTVSVVLGRVSHHYGTCPPIPGRKIIPGDKA